MSTENHPNFHACKFASDITASFYKSLRGQASKENCPDVRNFIVNFVDQIEREVDVFVFRQNVKRKEK